MGLIGYPILGQTHIASMAWHEMEPDVAVEQVGADATVIDLKKQIDAEAIDADWE